MKNEVKYLDTLSGDNITYAVNVYKMAENGRAVYKELIALVSLFDCSYSPGHSMSPFYILPHLETDLEEIEKFMRDTNIPFTKLHRTAVQ